MRTTSNLHYKSKALMPVGSTSTTMFEASVRKAAKLTPCEESG
jgi:hypothetical protein